MTKTKPSVRPAKPKKATQFPLKIMLAFVVDGEARGHIPLDAEITTPDEGQGVQVVFPVDAKVLAQILEPLVGPSRQPASKLWTPSGAAPVRLASKD